jgi:hypothetical protein
MKAAATPVVQYTVEDREVALGAAAVCEAAIRAILSLDWKNTVEARKMGYILNRDADDLSKLRHKAAAQEQTLLRALAEQDDEGRPKRDAEGNWELTAEARHAYMTERDEILSSMEAVRLRVVDAELLFSLLPSYRPRWVGDLAPILNVPADEWDEPAEDEDAA